MADLIDRLSGESLPSRPKLHGHQFIGGLRLYAEGLKSRGEIAANWDLQGDELTQANAIADIIDIQVGVTAKIIYVLRFESIALLIEDRSDTFYHDGGGNVDKTAVITDAGL